MPEFFTSRALDYWLLWAVALFSAAVSVGALYFLALARRLAVDGARVASVVLHRVDEASLSCVIDVREQIPVRIVVPLDTQVTVPLDITLPIDVEVTVRLPTPLGGLPVKLPVRADVPVKMDVPVPIRAEIPVSASVPVDLSIPVELKLADMTLSESLHAAMRLAERTMRRLWAGLMGT